MPLAGTFLWRSENSQGVSSGDEPAHALESEKGNRTEQRPVDVLQTIACWVTPVSLGNEKAVQPAWADQVQLRSPFMEHEEQATIITTMYMHLPMRPGQSMYNES